MIDRFLTIASIGLFIGTLVWSIALLLEPRTLLIPVWYFLLGGIIITIMGKR